MDISIGEFTGIIGAVATFCSAPTAILWRLVVKRNAACETRVTALEKDAKDQADAHAKELGELRGTHYREMAAIAMRIDGLQEKRIADHQDALEKFIDASKTTAERLSVVAAELREVVRGR